MPAWRWRSFGANEKSSLLLTPGAAATRRFRAIATSTGEWRSAFRAEPLHGVGAGNWAVCWLRYRTIDEFAQDAHSLPIQTLAELGVVGLALLAVFLAGIGLAARAAYRAAPALAAGPIAGVIVWIAHSPVDWDWQMPAVTLIAMGLTGALLALREAGEHPAAAAGLARPAGDIATDAVPIST